MIKYETAKSQKDLEGILLLQKANLAQGLTAEDILSQGFVTVSHTLEQLEKLNDFEKHIIAKVDDRIVGYVLAMTQEAKFEIPILLSMFIEFERISYNEKKIVDFNYIVIGQVCVEKECRGQGIFDESYRAYKKAYSEKYDFAITEIASSNIRSLNAHKRIGFKDIHSFIDEFNTEWIVVVWDWKNIK